MLAAALATGGASLSFGAGPLSKEEFFKQLKNTKPKKMDLATELRSRGASFKLTSAEENEALRLGADVSMLVAIRMYYTEPGQKPQRGAAKPESKDPPRMPRT